MSKKFLYFLIALFLLVLGSLFFFFVEIPRSNTDTSNWKTYKNEEYGFEFKYPGDKNLVINEEINRVCVYGSCVDYKKHDGEISFSELQKIATHKDTEWAMDYWKGISIIDGKIGSRHSYVIPGMVRDQEVREIIVSNNGMIYTLTDFDPNILSTFKFTH